MFFQPRPFHALLKAVLLQFRWSTDRTLQTPLPRQELLVTPKTATSSNAGFAGAAAGAAGATGDPAVGVGG